MKIFDVLVLTSALLVFGCDGQKDIQPIAPQSDNERIETLANFLQVRA